MKNLIIGSFGFGSTGDEALLSCELDYFNRVNCTVLTYDQLETRAMHNVNTHEMVLENNSITLNNLDDYDRYIIGGGALFGIGGNEPLSKLLCEFIDSTDKDVINHNVDVSSPSEHLKVFSNDNVKRISVRNKRSFENLKSLGIVDNIPTYIDGYYTPKMPRISRSYAKHILQIHRVPENTTLVGINISHPNIQRLDFFKDVVKFLVDNDCTVIGINSLCHKLSPNTADIECISILNNEIGDLILNTAGSYNLNRSFHPYELKGIIGELDLLISCRKHPALMAYGENVPTILTSTSTGEIAEHVRPLLYAPCDMTKSETVIEYIKQNIL